MNDLVSELEVKLLELLWIMSDLWSWTWVVAVGEVKEVYGRLLLVLVLCWLHRFNLSGWRIKEIKVKGGLCCLSSLWLWSVICYRLLDQKPRLLLLLRQCWRWNRHGWNGASLHNRHMLFLLLCLSLVLLVSKLLLQPEKLVLINLSLASCGKSCLKLVLEPLMLDGLINLSVLYLECCVG